MSIELTTGNYKYGFHTLKLKKLFDTVERVWKYFPCNAMQIYISNGRSYTTPDCDAVDVKLAREFLRDHEVWLCIHGCLLYNLCGSVNHSADQHFERNLSNTINNLSVELDIGAGLGCGGVVVHPNSCKDKNKGLEQISKTITTVLTKYTPLTKRLATTLKIKESELIKQRKILLENCAGEGTKRGGSLEELRDMILGVPVKLQNQIGVCIDTAHAFGYGLVDWGIEEIGRASCRERV